MVLQTVSIDTVRSFLVGQDWSQRTKREGTFVLDSPETPSPASIRNSTPLKKQPLEHAFLPVKCSELPITSLLTQMVTLTLEVMISLLLSVKSRRPFPLWPELIVRSEIVSLLWREI